MQGDTCTSGQVLANGASCALKCVHGSSKVGGSLAFTCKDNVLQYPQASCPGVWDGLETEKYFNDRFGKNHWSTSHTSHIQIDYARIYSEHKDWDTLDKVPCLSGAITQPKPMKHRAVRLSTDALFGNTVNVNKEMVYSCIKGSQFGSKNNVKFLLSLTK